MNKDAQSEARAKIVLAAQERLWHYGYKKTTIDEIAADAGIGKGTIYLHFSSKEAIALEIMAQFKRESLTEVGRIAANQDQPLLSRIKEILLQPILMAHERCMQSPAALEMVAALRPNLHEHLKPFLQEEIAILALVLEQGNSQGIFAIDDCKATARLLKHMCYGFLPPYSSIIDAKAIQEAVRGMVDMAYYGFHAGNKVSCENYEQNLQR